MCAGIAAPVKRSIWRSAAAFGVIGERNGDARRARAARAADAVDIVLRLPRQVEIDYVGDAGHVDAARRDVGRDQRAHAAAAHVRQRAVALALVHVAMQRGGGVALAVQARGQRFGVALGRDEDDALLHRRVGEQVVQQAVLVRVIVGEMHALLDR